MSIEPAVNEIVGFKQQNSKASSAHKYGLSQSGQRGKTYTARGTHLVTCYRAVITTKRG